MFRHNILSYFLHIPLYFPHISSCSSIFSTYFLRFVVKSHQRGMGKRGGRWYADFRFTPLPRPKFFPSPIFYTYPGLEFFQVPRFIYSWRFPKKNSSYIFHIFLSPHMKRINSSETDLCHIDLQKIRLNLYSSTLSFNIIPILFMQMLYTFLKITKSFLKFVNSFLFFLVHSLYNYYLTQLIFFFFLSLFCILFYFIFFSFSFNLYRVVKKKNWMILWLEARIREFDLSRGKEPT